MPASLRDVRVVSPAVNLPGLQFRRSPSRYGLQAICGTASAAVIELQ